MRSQLWRHVAVGGVCLAVGAAGTAGASSLITGKSIKDGTIEAKDLSKKARKALTGKAGPRGRTGATGAQGVAGQNGAPGAPGAPAPALVIGNMGVSTSADLFATPIGGSFGGEASAQTPIPPGGGLTARDLAVHLNNAPGATSVVLTFRADGADTPLTCTITGSAKDCQASGATAALSPGALIDFHATASGSLPGGTFANWSLRLTP